MSSRQLLTKQFQGQSCVTLRLLRHPDFEVLLRFGKINNIKKKKFMSKVAQYYGGVWKGD
jgi:hypothetical protein